MVEEARGGDWAIVLGRTRGHADPLFGSAGSILEAVLGRRSLLQRAVLQARRVAGPHRTIVVLSRRELSMALPHLDGEGVEHVLLEPAERGSVASVLLGLTFIGRRDPNAVVVVIPTDRLTFPTFRLLASVRTMIEHSVRHGDEVLLAAVGGSRERESDGGGRTSAPEMGAVVVARAGALLGLWKRVAPALARQFCYLRPRLGATLAAPSRP